MKFLLSAFSFLLCLGAAAQPLTLNDPAFVANATRVAAAVGSACDSVNDSSLKGWWKLDETSGSAVDSKGDNDLTETGGTIDSAAGKVDNARDFEAGDTEWFEIADNADLSTGDVDFTFGCWFYAETLVSFPVLANKGWSAPIDINSEWVVYYNTANNVLKFSAAYGGSETEVAATSAGALSTGVWYFVLVWHDASSNVIGVSINNGTASTAGISSGLNDGNRAFKIGASDTQSLYFDGRIDEAFLTKRLLTTEEKTALYNAGSACRPSGL